MGSGVIDLKAGVMAGLGSFSGCPGSVLPCAALLSRAPLYRGPCHMCHLSWCIVSTSCRPPRDWGRFFFSLP